MSRTNVKVYVDPSIVQPPAIRKSSCYQCGKRNVEVRTDSQLCKHCWLREGNDGRTDFGGTEEHQGIAYGADNF